MKSTNEMQLYRSNLLFLVSSTCFGWCFCSIIRSTWLYLHHLVIFTTVAAGWCHGWVGTTALHVSGDVFAHHQEHFTVFTSSGYIHHCRCRLVSWMSWNDSPTCFGRCFRPSSGALDYLHHLVIFTIVAAGWCHEWVGTTALHVWGDVFAHHQEHLIVFTSSGNIHHCRCRLVSCMSWNDSSACLGRCFRPSSGALDCIYIIW